MKVAIVGAGFTGLAAAFKLIQNNQQVTVFEKEKSLGGLAATFKEPGWRWAVEKHYHHWFTNDAYALSLINDLGLGDKLIVPKSQTSIYVRGKIYPFNSPINVLTFAPLPIADRIRCGIILLFLKLLPINLAVKLEKYTAYEWLHTYFGKNSFNILWQPLLEGKFGPYAKTVNMAWFWARIKKRTPQLGYLKGGYNLLLQALARRISENGGKVLLGYPFKTNQVKNFDKIILTTPSAIFATLFPQLPQSYIKNLTSIPHLHAVNLLLITREKILDNTYWLNINEKGFPFIGLIQHTNLAPSKYYANNHLAWVANYLPPDHPYLKMTKEELFNIYKPYLKKINPKFNLQLTPPAGGHNSQLFIGPFAQPVFPANYSQKKPDFKTPLKNVYLANMDMVYPWDRGTNYAIELGYKVAEYVMNDR